MMILNPLKFLRGGGKGGGEIPKLVPPKNQSVKRSISVAETIDLLSEGPIYGIVDRYGKKVGGINMLRGVYLNATPIIDSDGLYNFRNVLVELNTGEEFQDSLLNFRQAYVNKNMNFKLLGKIDSATGAQSGRGSVDLRDDRNFSKWGTSTSVFSAGFPLEDSPYAYTHIVNNKDVESATVTLNVEAMFDTSDKGAGKNDGGDMGTPRPTSINFMVSYGVVGVKQTYVDKQYTVYGNSSGGYLVTLGGATTQSLGDNYLSEYMPGGGGFDEKTVGQYYEE